MVGLTGGVGVCEGVLVGEGGEGVVVTVGLGPGFFEGEPEGLGSGDEVA